MQVTFSTALALICFAGCAAVIMKVLSLWFWAKVSNPMPTPDRSSHSRVREILASTTLAGHAPVVGVEEEMTEESPMTSDREMLARIDERTKAQSTAMEQKDIFLRGEMDKIARAVAAIPGEIDAKLRSYATNEALKAVSDRLANAERVINTIGMAIILGALGAVAGLIFKG